MFELKKQKTFIVRTDWGPNMPGNEQPVIVETYVSCMVCSVTEFKAQQGTMTMINADHAQIAVQGCFYEIEEVTGAGFLM